MNRARTELTAPCRVPGGEYQGRANRALLEAFGCGGWFLFLFFEMVPSGDFLTDTRIQAKSVLQSSELGQHDSKSGESKENDKTKYCRLPLKQSSFVAIKFTDVITICGRDTNRPLDRGCQVTGTERGPASGGGGSGRPRSRHAPGSAPRGHTCRPCTLYEK